jgi:hypothetical protein
VSAPTPVPPTSPSPKFDEAAELTTKHVAALLAAFNDWAKAHPGAPCPSANDLGDAGIGVDGWGHAMAVTCTDQPGDQIIGVRSGGADGQMNTGDDVTSWNLGHAVTAAVAGPRWVVTPPATTAVPSSTKPTTAAKPAGKPATVKSKPATVELDENGMPISR